MPHNKKNIEWKRKVCFCSSFFIILNSSFSSETIHNNFAFKWKTEWFNHDEMFSSPNNYSSVIIIIKIIIVIVIESIYDQIKKECAFQTLKFICFLQLFTQMFIYFVIRARFPFFRMLRFLKRKILYFNFIL
jgi:hypothetical protein